MAYYKSKDYVYYLGKKVLGEYNHFDKNNYMPIEFSFMEVFDTEPTTHLIKDLIDLKLLKDNEYRAFGVGLPKNIIIEVFQFGNKHKDIFSILVKKYPFAQLVFTQWLTIKLYERHKILTRNPYLDYEEFLKNFTFTFNKQNYHLLNAINKINTQEINNIDDEFFNVMDIRTAISVDVNCITLYDIVYDIVPNSIKRVFLKDEATLKAYLPLKQDRFFYQEISYKNHIENSYRDEYFDDEDDDMKVIFRNLYGKDEIYDESKIPKEYHKINTLVSKDYLLNPLIPKAKIHKFGIGYDELWELINTSEKDLDYLDIWEFDLVDAPELKEYYIDEDGNLCIDNSQFYSRVVPDYQHKANYRDIIRCSADVDFLGFPEVKTRAMIIGEEASKMLYKRRYESVAFLLQNNFYSSNSIFESYRMEIRENENFRKAVEELLLGSIFAWGWEDNPYWYGWAIRCDAYLAYRFNQALALTFLNAYNGERNGI